MASLTKLIISRAIRAHKQAVRDAARREREAERARKAHERATVKLERERERSRRARTRRDKAKAKQELEALKDREEAAFKIRKHQREHFKLRFLRELMK